jgi:hypothetical protein
MTAGGYRPLGTIDVLRLADFFAADERAFAGRAADLRFGGAAAPGLTALMNCGAMGEPRPVQGSQPDLAGKLPLSPWVMSRNAGFAFVV